jgi:tRNA nucleotidyltransferase (CCA-adding enzyme)
MKKNKINLNNETYLIVNELKKHGLKTLLVGGMVRDYWINKSKNKLLFKPKFSKDIDLEVYGETTYEKLNKILNKFGKINIVGKHFGVIKLKIGNEDFDISLPRIEKSIGLKHLDFEIKIDSNLKYKEAFKRRDFTMNAIGYDIIEEKFIDPFNGIRDISERKIKHINEKNFIEDPLRVYRAIQFSSRFNMNIKENTKKLILKMIKNNSLDNLPKERIFEEINKLFLKSKKPSLGFKLLKEFGITEKYFKELNDIYGIPQEKDWHPEGTVDIHTLMVVDKMAEILSEEIPINKKLLYFYSSLCHDFGKVSTTKFINGKIRSQKHELAGIKPTKSFLLKLTNETSFIKEVSSLVKYHLAPSVYYKQKAKMNAIKRLAKKVNLFDLITLNKADVLGRTTLQALNNECPQYEYFLDIIENQLKIEKEKLFKEKKLITGKDLIKIGIKPGEIFSIILSDIEEKTIDEKFKEKEKCIIYIKEKYLNNELNIRN